MNRLAPVFYDCEATDVEGYPIEIGWAFADPETSELRCESHLIRPPDEWPVKESWDKAAERLHGLTLAQVRRDGRPVWEIAKRMNAMFDGRELFSDSPHDERWLRLIFDAAGLDPSFTIRRTDARVLIASLAAEQRIGDAGLERAKAMAAELAPRRHRAEPDARHLATLWNIVTRGDPTP